jgi:hypothetical protein
MPFRFDVVGPASKLVLTATVAYNLTVEPILMHLVVLFAFFGKLFFIDFPIFLCILFLSLLFQYRNWQNLIHASSLEFVNPKSFICKQMCSISNLILFYQHNRKLIWTILLKIWIDCTFARDETLIPSLETRPMTIQTLLQARESRAYVANVASSMNYAINASNHGYYISVMIIYQN